jgi:hypothetical protein
MPLPAWNSFLFFAQSSLCAILFFSLCHNPIFDHFILIIIIILFIEKDKKNDDNDEKTSKMK